jgi:thiamine pyrophosphokinase
MEALLAIGGDGPPRESLAERFPSFGLVCAADSGLDLLKAWGLAPQLIVGDMDSLSDISLLDAYPGAEVHRFPREKDDSDTEIGMRMLRERGAARIVLAGGGGGRLDHLLALRAMFERPLHPAEWHTANESCWFVEEGADLVLRTAAGDLLSVFPFSRGSSGMRSEGLAWPLNGLSWGPGDFGLSNEATQDRVRIAAGKGSLLVVALRSARRPS